MDCINKNMDRVNEGIDISSKLLEIYMKIYVVKEALISMGSIEDSESKREEFSKLTHRLEVCLLDLDNTIKNA